MNSDLLYIFYWLVQYGPLGFRTGIYII